MPCGWSATPRKAASNPWQSGGSTETATKAPSEATAASEGAGEAAKAGRSPILVAQADKGPRLVDPAEKKDNGKKRGKASAPVTVTAFGNRLFTGTVNLLHGGNGMYMDRFVTAGYPGMLLLHGNGDVLERTLRPGEKILVEPGGFLYKDSTVQMQAVQMPLNTGMLRHGMYLAEMTGPGRVGIQSMYVHHHASE